MTNSLYHILKTGDLVRVVVDDKMKECYFPEFLHDVLGEIWDIDDEHIYVQTIIKDIAGKEYLSGPYRYCWSDITVVRA